MNQIHIKGSVNQTHKRSVAREASAKSNHETLVWLTYDLGIHGDYTGLYTWLASKGAKECGDDVAAFRYTYRRDLVKELAAELKKNIKIERNARAYVIYKRDGSIAGRFLFGRRRIPRWAEFSSLGDDVEDSM